MAQNNINCLNDVSDFP